MKVHPSDLSVIWHGPYLSHSGFSKMNRELAIRLAKRGVKVQTKICDTKIEVDNRTLATLQKMINVQVPSKTPMVYSMTMPSIISNDGPRILFTMMESSNGLHQDYAEKLNLASEIWVPTHHMTDMMHDANVCSPVYIVPLGVDTNIFNEKTERMRLPHNARNYRFLSVSWWGPRKGFDILIKAFVGEFSGDEDVCLIISSRSHDNKSSEYISNEIKNIVKSTGKTNRPPVLLHSGITTDSELATLYNACDAFVLASKGEGFSMPIVEAASCGLPIISTRCTAQATYLNDDNAYLLNPEGFEKANPQDGRPSNVGRWCRYYENQMFPVFGGKSIKELGHLMRSVYSDRKTAEKKASILTNRVHTAMTWENSVDVVIERLSALVLAKEIKT